MGGNMREEDKIYYVYNQKAIASLFTCIILMMVSFNHDGIVMLLVRILVVGAMLSTICGIRQKVIDIECPHCGKNIAFPFDGEAGTCIYCNMRILKTENGYCCSNDIKK